MNSDDLRYLKTLTLLYVEDSDIIREQLAQFLQRRCAVLHLAADGQQGLELFLHHRPDIVITDILMPVMDGLKMSEVIRSHTPKTPIIITTAFEEPRYLQQAIDIDIDRYVTKPVDLNLFEAALIKCARAIRAEAALRELQERSIELAEAQHIAKLGHWRFDLQSQQLNWSEETFHIFEADKTQFNNSYPAFLATVHPDDRERVDQAYQAHLNYNAVCDFEHRIRLADGRIKYIHQRCQTERDASGKPLRSLGTVQDITERKQVEFELESYRHHLEDLVDIRTAELEKAKDQAESANRAKSVFLANMSHELRTPLNAILGFAQLMEHDAGLSTDHRNQLQTINRAGQHLLALINDVLEISRIEAGRVVVQQACFDLAEMLMAIEEMIHIRASSKGLTFKFEQIGNLPRFVVGDAHHLRQVLINLLGNAVKYTDHGQITLRLTASHQTIRFEIEDTGAGIAEDDLAKIFQAFYQTQHGITKGEGTGLGLTISQEFVRLMGGEISVVSSVGQGSRFSFTLPLPEGACPEEKENPPQRVIGLTPAHPPVRVLVAEDHPDNRELIRCLLSNAGFEVLTTNDGQQAVEAFQSWQPDFIWMDMRMPVLDGYEATKQIRALPDGDKVKIVALTASVFQEDQADIFAAGCDALLAKPLEAAKIFAMMGDLLGLEYCYDGNNEAAPQPSGQALDFSNLGADFCRQLQQAAELLDVEATQQLIAELRNQRPELAQQLFELVDSYRFDKITDALKNTAQPS